MVLSNNDPATAEIRKLNLLLSNLDGQLSDVQSQVAVQERNIRSLIDTQAALPPYPVSNLLWNGELGHSVFTWNEVTGTPSGDKNEECAWWYSHAAPTAGQQLFATTAATSSTNNELKTKN